MNEIEKLKSKILLSGTIIYAIGNLGTKILSFLIVPLYTYYISTSDMGDYDLVNTTISLLTPLITLQITDAAYAWMLNEKAKITDCITVVYKFIIATSLITAAVMLLINHFVEIKFCYYMILQLILSRFFGVLQKLLRGLKNQKLFTASGIIYTAVFLLLNLLQIVVLKQGVEALFQSAIISYAFCTILVLICEKRLRTFSIKTSSFQLQKEMLKFSIPLVPNQLNWWIMNTLDRYIIRFFLGSSANGIFAIAHKFPSVLQLVFNIFYMSWQDMAIVDKDKDAGKFYTKVFKLYYQFAFTFLVFLIPFTKLFITYSMEESYHSATLYVGFLYLGTVFQAFSSFFGVGYLKNNKTKQAASTSIYGAIINALFDVVLMKFIGLYAAAVSTFLGFFTMFVIRVVQTKKTMQIKIDMKKFVLLFIVCILSVVISIFTNTTQDLIMSAAGIVLFLVVNHKVLINTASKMYKKIKSKRS